MAVVNDILTRALYTPKARARYGYIAPFYSQAKQIAWDYLKHFSQQVRVKASESALSVDLFNDARITLFGADNPDSMRGLYFDGVSIDEYGNCRPSLYTEIIRPALSDRQGWATFIGTPNGPNHFYRLWETAATDPDNWFSLRLPASESNILPLDELEQMRELMLPDEYESEMECSWFASVKGAFYGNEVQSARVGGFPPVPHVPCHYVFDLGYTDSTAIWRWQEFNDHITLSHAEQWDSKPISFYIDWLHQQRTNGLNIGQVWLPHDAKAKSLQTGRSIVELFLSAGITPRIVPNLDINDGIAAARHLFPTLVFDAQGCAAGLNALKSYHREWNQETQAFRDRPHHDHSSHFADAFRYFALVARCAPNKEEAPPDPPHIPALHYGFTMDQIWETRPSTNRRL